MARLSGLVGLLVSLVAIAALTVAYFAPALALAFAADALVQGPRHALDVLRHANEASVWGSQNAEEIAWFVVGCAIYIAILPAIVTFAKWRAGAEWRSLVAWTPWSPAKAGWRYWLFLAGALVYGVAASSALGLLRPGLRSIERLPTGGAGLAVSIVLAVILAPLAEEALFRGWIYTNLRSYFSAAPANIASAAVFALAHWEKTHLIALAIFPLGLMLGYVREKTGSTRASMAFHAVYNGFAVALSLAAASQQASGGRG